jgi:hypothetical protein
MSSVVLTGTSVTVPVSSSVAPGDVSTADDPAFAIARSMPRIALVARLIG